MWKDVKTQFEPVRSPMLWSTFKVYLEMCLEYMISSPKPNIVAGPVIATPLPAINLKLEEWLSAYGSV
jgi:hypothetical protein